MTNFRIINSERLDGHAVIQTLEDVDGHVPVGVFANIANLATNTGLNGNQQLVVSVVPYRLLEVDDYNNLIFDYEDIRLNQVILLNAGADLELAAESAGTLTYEPSITWITTADVTEWLGIATATANDTAFLAKCVAAANVWCYRRRSESNYHDDVDAVPDDAVKLGTILYAATLYRERGSVDSFASFDDMAASPQFGSMTRIKQLLGIGRPSVG
jgi:hypothetical protein